ncbi:MAG: hypothetical protein IJ086_03720 [Clostridium sp.]|nr:hypothetical protein [Clostridium sp.]
MSLAYEVIESVSYEVVESIEVIPVIMLNEANFNKVYNILINNVFNEGGKGYFTNRKHLVEFNGNLIITWINNKDFIHLIMDNSHYRIDLKKNSLVVADSYHYNMKKIIKDECVNCKSTSNIYQ